MNNRKTKKGGKTSRRKTARVLSSLERKSLRKRLKLLGGDQYSVFSGDNYDEYENNDAYEYNDDEYHEYHGATNAQGQPDGRGTMTWYKNNVEVVVYTGEWKDGEMHGEGKMTYEDGDVYEGQWKNNKMHGKGEYKYKNGDVYEGDWKNGKIM